jgi:hypothetical protein
MGVKVLWNSHETLLDGENKPYNIFVQTWHTRQLEERS